MEDDVGLNFDFEGGLDAVTAASGQAPPPQAAAVAVHYAAGQGMGSAPRGGQMRRSFRQTVCRHWLRGLCMKGNDCGFLHQYDKSRMPLCRFFARFGECREPDCIYKHSTEDIKECNMYKLGFCPNGPDCRYRHEKLPGPPPPLEQHLAKLQQRYQPNHQQRQQQAANHLQPEAAPRPPMGMQGPESMGTPQHSGNGPSRPQKMMSASSPLPYGYSRYFVVKSSNRENLELSVQRGVWATHRNNEAKLNEALDSCDHVILIFSVNETRHFQGCAKMLSKAGYAAGAAGYAAGAAGWKGTAHYGRNFCLKWLKLCELSFNKTRHLRNPYNENLPVKISRDCQELEATVGEQLAQLLYLEPDSELMAAANEAEGKREAQGGATTTTDDASIVPFEENEEEVEEDESDEESASVSHGRGGMGRGQHWKAGRGMRGRGMGYPHGMGMDFGMEGYGMPGDMFGVPPGHGFPHYFPPGPAFANPEFAGMGMSYGPMEGSGFHGRPPNGMLPMGAPVSMGPPRPYGMPFRPPYPGAGSAEKGGRGGKMAQMKRRPPGDGTGSDSGGKDGGQDRSSVSGFHAKQDEYDYKANYREDGSESEDEAPRRSRHGEGKKKRRELEDQAKQ